MQIAPLGGGEKGMPLGIMQEQQRPAAQHLAGAPHQATWDQVIGVDGLLMSIHVHGTRWLAWLLRLHRPEGGGPLRQGIGQCFVATWERNRSVCQKPEAR